jgi:hypothetical protein
MALTMQDLTVSISHLDRHTLLSDWLWLIGPNKVPVLVTALGNVFLLDKDTGAVHVLDAGPGTLQQVAATGDDFRARLRDKDFVVEQFAPIIVVRMRERGYSLQPGQLYSFRTPPALGGEYSPDNLEPTNIETHFARLGQLHDRSRCSLLQEERPEEAAQTEEVPQEALPTGSQGP